MSSILTNLPQLTAATNSDWLYIVDVSDTTDNPAGSSKKILRGDLYTQITGFTYLDNTITLSLSDNSTYAVTINTMTGLTINGDIVITGQTTTGSISATTYYNLPLDVYTTGGTYFNGTLTFTNNSGGTYNVTGLVTGDTYWTSGSTGNFSIKAKNDSGLDATDDYAVAEGKNTLSTGLASHAEGVNTTANGDGSHAEGSSSYAGGNYSHAEGSYTYTSGLSSHAEGRYTMAHGDYSHTEGDTTIAGWRAFAVDSVINGIITLSPSYGNITSGFTGTQVILDHTIRTYHTVTFSSTTNTEILLDDITINTGSFVADLSDLYMLEADINMGHNSHSEGTATKAIGENSHAEGENTKSIGPASHAEGFLTTASGNASHAEGNNTQAIGGSSHAEGIHVQTIGNGSHGEGVYTQAIGNGSHAEGYLTRSGSLSYRSNQPGNTSTKLILDGVYGDITSQLTGSLILTPEPQRDSNILIKNSDIINITFSSTTNTEIFFSGNINLTPIFYSDCLISVFRENTIGDRNYVVGYYSHAEGESTNAFGYNSHAEGWYTNALGYNSHAEGYETTAIGRESHAGGDNSTASGDTSFIHSNRSIVLGDRSVVLGGIGITGTADDTVYVPYFNIQSATTDNILTEVLVIDINGDVKKRSVNTIGFTGGTVSGATIFTGGLSASTFSATTYYNLPLDVYTTGGTYNNTTGIVTFINNSGGTFDVTGFFKPSDDNYTTGYTYNNNTLTLKRNNSLPDLSVTIDTLTGLTINGNLTVTGLTTSNAISANTITATTITATNYENLPFTDNETIEGFISGDTTYVRLKEIVSAPSGGTRTFLGNVIVSSGFTASTISATTYYNLPVTIDTYTTGFTFNVSNYDLTIKQNNGQTDLTVNLGILSSDITITGGTYSPTTGIATFTNNTGGTFNVSGFITGMTDTYVTGFTYSNNTLTIKQNAGQPDLSVNIDVLTGLTINGDLIVTGQTTTDSLSANTITASTITATNYENLPFTDNETVEIFLSGGTEYLRVKDIVSAPSGGTRTFLGNVIVNSGFTASTISATTYYNLPVTIDTYTTGGTYNNTTGIATFTNNTGGTFNVSGFYTGATDTYTTGYTYNNNTFTIKRNNGLSDLSVNVNTMTGLTINGDLIVTGRTTSTSISATTITADTITATNYENLPFTDNQTLELFISGGTEYARLKDNISAPSGGTRTFQGDIVVNGGFTANTISATTYYNLPVAIDTYTTGFTFNTSNYDLTIKRNNSQPDLTVNLGILSSDVTITGGTYNPTTGSATFTNNTGGTFSVSGFLTGMTDTYVTGFTYSNNRITIKQNAGQPDLTVDINTLTGLTINGNLTVTGLTTSNEISANTITATTITATNYENLPFTDNQTIEGFVSGDTTYVRLKEIVSAPSGGTRTFLGNVIVNSGFTASTISATTYYNLPTTIDTYTTGGTYNNSTGIATFTNNTGGTFNVTGFYTGSTDNFTTGYTYNDNTFTIKRNNNLPDLSVNVNTMTGLTINGNINITGQTTTGSISATTYYNLPLDVFTTGGTYSNGTLTFTNNSGGTFNVSGLITGTTDSYTTGFTYSNNTFTLSRNNGLPNLTATINSLTGLTINGDLTVTGRTITNSLSASTITATTVTADNYENLPFTDNQTVEIFLSGGTEYLRVKDTISAPSGGTRTFQGNVVVNNGFTANTISATTYYNLPTTVDTFTTGFTFNTSNYDLTIKRNNSQPDLTVNLGILSSDVTITGGTYNSTTGIATFTNNTGGTFNVTGFLTGMTDTYVTGFTYNNNTLTIKQTAGQPDLLVNINTLTGLTINGDIIITGQTTTNSLSATTISATTYYNLPQDIFTTGGTYNNTTGIATFTNNSGGTFNVTGFLTGATDSYTTGYTYSDNTFTLKRNNSLPDLSVSVNTMTGLTINGDLIVTGQTTSGSVSATTMTATTITADNYENLPFTDNQTLELFISGGTEYARLKETISAPSGGTRTFQGNVIVNSGFTASTISATTYYNLPTTIDTFTTGGTYNNTTGIATFTNNTGGTFNVSGFYTGATDSYTTGFTFNSSNYDLTIKRNNSLPDLTVNLGILSSDVTITGGTYNPTTGIAIFTNNTGGTFSVSGFLTGMTDTYVSGFTYSNNNLTIKQTAGQPDLLVNINTLTGLTINGDLTVTGLTTSNAISANTITATTITATDYQNLPFTDNQTIEGFVSGDTTYVRLKETISAPSGGTRTFQGNVVVSSGFTASTISATTYYNLPTITGAYLPLSGGTVYGPAVFSGGITANTLNVTGLTQTSGITSTGGITFKQVTINSSYSATTSDYMIDVTGGTFTVYLPSAVGIQGRLLVVKNNGGGAVTVDPYGNETIDGKSFVILGETNSIQLASNGTEWVALGYNISTINSSTGVFEFTGLTKVTNTTFRVAPVKGWIVDDTTNPLSPQLYYVTYSGGTHTATYVNTATETWVYLTSGGTISQSNVLLTDQQRRQNIFLGKLGHADKTTIINAFSQPDFVLSPLSQLRDMFDPIGFVNEGIRPSANGVNLSFNTSAGYLHGLGINFTNDVLNPNTLYVSGTSPCTFQYRTQTGGTATNVTVIDPTKYDVGGVVTSVSGTKATNQRIYLVQNGVFRIQYGQTVYSTLPQAIAGISSEPFIEFSNFTSNGILIGILSVLSSASDLTDTSKAQFFNVSKFGDSAGAAGGSATTTLQQAYNNSTTPEITTNSILGALSIKNGSGGVDNVTRLLEGQTAANGVTSFIRADGYISGTTFQTNGFNANSDGVTASTISATTYYNLPVTVDTFTTGFTFNVSNYDLTIKRNNSQPDLTVNLGILSSDITITGGTYNPTTGIAIFTNNTGGTFSVSGFMTGMTDTYVSGFTYSDNNLTIKQTAGKPDLSVNVNTMTGLTVNGNLTVTGGTQSWFSGNSSSDLVRITQTGTGNAFVVEDSNNTDSTPFVIDANGNVGIGTTSPNAKLDVTGSINNTISGQTLSTSYNSPVNRLDINSNVNLGFQAGASGGIFFYVNGSASDRSLWLHPSSAVLIGNPTATSPNATLHVTNVGTPNSFLVEDSDNPDGTPFVVDAIGNVGVGTTSPTEKLDVNGNAIIKGDLVLSSSTAAIFSLIGTDHVYQQYYPQGISSGRFAYTGFGEIGSTDFRVFNETATGNFSLGTNSTNRLFISASGNVGIGTTTPTEKLVVNGNTIITGSITVTGGTQSLFSGNSSVEMVKIIQAGSGDAFVVQDQANGDASHFVINASGNTAIGLTQPIGNDKLTVSGNTGIYGTLSVTTISATTYQNLPKVGFSPINVGVCDTAPTAASTQYYYQTVGEVTATLSKVKLWGFSGSDLVLFGIYRGSLGGSMTLIGQARGTCGLGSNELTLTAETGQNLTITAGEDLVVGYYPDGTSWRTIYDVGISDINFGISNTNNITTMPATPTGTATGIRFACTLY